MDFQTEFYMYPGIEPGSPALQADPLSSEPPGKPMYEALNG